MMKELCLIFTLYALGIFVSCQEGAGKCVCREYRCEEYEHNGSGCQSTSFYSGHGISCCKPYCTCRESCNPGESNEGQHGIPLWVEENEHYLRRWEMANSGTKDEAGSCAVNQTFCCPSCVCRDRCKLAEVIIAKRSCGEKDMLCCTNQTRNWRCLDGEILFGKFFNERYCGQCTCRKTCTTGEKQQPINTCLQNQNLCCRRCNCKSTCTGNETMMDHDQCPYGHMMCCEDCKCKTGCDVTERDQGKDTCLYGLTRCCYP